MEGKRVKLDSKIQTKKCAKRYLGDDTPLSQLPEDILVVILSFLSLKEAARTSVLSSRWINLWKHTSCLDFDADSALNKIARRCKLRNRERRKYIDWVNCVLQSHKAPTLKHLRICFDLDNGLDISDQKAIDWWAEFAFMKRVGRFEFDFSEYGELLTCPSRNYSFPEELLTRSLIDFKSLTSLCLKCVNVSEEAIEFFLRNCRLLERLLVHGTDKLSNLEVCGPSLMLKHLDMFGLDKLESLKVYAPNLVSLKISRLKGLLLQNVPMLVEVSATCGIDISIKNLLPVFACCISQLEILTLELDLERDLIECGGFQELPKLKKLEISCWARCDRSLMELTSLIKACPNLREFFLELLCDKPSRSDRGFENGTRFPHHHLKAFRFYGYCGRASDVELVMYIVENCIVLEEIIIDPSDHLFNRLPPASKDLQAQQTARKYAKKQLEGQIPQRIDLIIK